MRKQKIAQKRDIPRFGRVIEGYHAVVEGGDAIISPELWQNSFSTSRCFAVFWKIWFHGEVYKYKL